MKLETGSSREKGAEEGKCGWRIERQMQWNAEGGDCYDFGDLGSLAGICSWAGKEQRQRTFKLKVVIDSIALTFFWLEPKESNKEKFKTV